MVSQNTNLQSISWSRRQIITTYSVHLGQAFQNLNQGQTTARPIHWEKFGSSHGIFISRVSFQKDNSFKDPTDCGIEVANILGAEQEHNHHALLTSLRSQNYLQAIKTYQAKRLRFSQGEAHCLSAKDQTWETKSIHIYHPIIISSKDRVSGS